MQKFPKTLIGFYWAMLKKFRAYAFAAVVLGTAISTWNFISSPLIDKYIFSIFNDGITPDFWEYAIPTFIMVAFLYYVAFPFSIIRNTIENRVRPRNSQYLREELYDYVYNNDYKFFLDKNVGKIQSQIRIIQVTFYKITTELLQKLGGIIIGLLVIGGILLGIDWKIMAIILTWGTIRIAWVIFYSTKYAKLRAEVSKIDSNIGGIISDSVLNYANVKIFTAAKFEREYVGKERDVFLGKAWKSWQFMYMQEKFMDFINAAVGLVILFLCLQLFVDGAIQVSGVAFVISSGWMVSRRFYDLGMVYNETIKDYMEAKQAWDEIITPYTITDKPNAPDLVVSRGAIDLRNISFKYNKNESRRSRAGQADEGGESRRSPKDEGGWVVHNMSLDIKSGERVGIVGLSGAGKTTLSHLLLRLFDVQRGGIFIDGQNIKNVRQDSLRGSIAFVPQDPVLFNRTLGENIGYAKPTATISEIERAAKLANIHDFIMSTKNGYDTIVGNRGIKLSGGQRQRIAIARAILKDAPILILDEATSSLDSDTERTIQESFATLMKNRTTVVIAHRLSTLRKMNRIVVMENGGIAEMGSHAALLKKGGIYARLWKMQSGGFIKE